MNTLSDSLMNRQRVINTYEDYREKEGLSKLTHPHFFLIEPENSSYSQSF